MNEQIQKLATLNNEVVELLKSEDMDGAVEKLAQVQELTKEMGEASNEPVEKEEEDDAPATVEPTEEEVAKSEAILKTTEALNKWASFNISADSIKQLMDEFADLKEQMLKEENGVVARVEKLEQSKGISKQAEEESKAPAGIWDSL